MDNRANWRIPSAAFGRNQKVVQYHEDVPDHEISVCCAHY
jgi:hypothetical protein